MMLKYILIYSIVFTFEDLEGCSEILAKLVLIGIEAKSLSFLYDQKFKTN